MVDVEKKEAEKSAKWAATITKATPLIIALVGTVIGVWANVDVQGSKDKSDKALDGTETAYRVLAERVNKLSEDVAFIRGQLSTMQAGHKDSTRPVILRVMPAIDVVDASTDKTAAALPSNLQLLMQRRDGAL
jgi:hypothetical protein